MNVVINFPSTTSETVLQSALSENLSEVFVIGYDADGQIYVAGSSDRIFEALAAAQHYLLCDCEE